MEKAKLTMQLFGPRECSVALKNPLVLQMVLVFMKINSTRSKELRDIFILQT